MERIVVGIDASENARQALRWALAEARLRGASVEVVHAWHFPGAVASPLAPTAAMDFSFEDDAQHLLDRIVDAEDTNGLEVRRVLVCGGAAQFLIEQGKGADMLVVGSRGRGGFAGLLLGSVSQQVVHHAPCPVVVIPEAA